MVTLESVQLHPMKPFCSRPGRCGSLRSVLSRCPGLPAFVLPALLVSSPGPRAAEVEEQGIHFQSERPDWIRQTAPALLATRERLFFHYGPVPDSGLLVIIAGDRASFEEAIGGAFPDWGIAAALPEARIIVLQAPGTRFYAEPYAQVVGHEYAHIYLHLLAGGKGRIPRWIDEGFAMQAAFEWNLDHYFRLGRAALWGSFLPLDQLDMVNSFGSDKAALAYTESFAAYAYLEEQWGRETVIALIRALAAGAEPDAAFWRVLGLGRREFAQSFAADVRSRYHFIDLFTDMGFIWGLLAMLIVVGWLVKRRRARETERRWQIEDRIHGEPDFNEYVDRDDDETWRSG
jgi:hypothetical protein